LDDGAERLLQEAIQFYNREKKGVELARAYLDLSRIHLDREDFKKEIYYLNKSVDINRMLKDTLLDITIGIEKSNSYVRLGEKNKALGTAERALALSKEIDDPASISWSLLAVGNAYRIKKNPKLSIDYLRQSHQLTAPSQKKDEKIQELSEEKNSAEFNVRKQRNLLISALIGFLAILAGDYRTGKQYENRKYARDDRRTRGRTGTGSKRFT